ncbi:MAG: methyltransferase domain-containing protein [bacterium]
MEEVRKTFQEIAERYDRYRRQLIPCFDAFYGAVAAMVPFDSEAAFRALDLGAGTGLLTQGLSRRFPKAQFTLIDFTAEMLEQARRRFGADAPHRYILADYAESEWEGSYDLIVSSLSIHHLPDAGKRRLYAKVFEHLAPGGAFINAEFVCSASEAVQRRHWERWIAQMRAAGLSPEEVDQALARTAIDILAPVETQTAWLRELGFRDVECYFRDGLFAVFGGRK